MGALDVAAVSCGFIQTIVHARDVPRRDSMSVGLIYAVASTEAQRKSAPLIHILCRMTASLRATAITARRWPRVLASRIPQTFSDDQAAVRVIKAWAAV